MDADSEKLRRDLKSAGLSDGAIKAAWPSWWSDDAADSKSARVELRFAIARKLGLSPASLSEGRVEYVWRDDTRFKRLSNQSSVEQAALSSFGAVIGKALLRGTTETQIAMPSAYEVRNAVLAKEAFVDLQALLALCWALGVPVIHLRVFPLKAKRMHAMVVRSGDRFAVLLGKDANYPPSIAFTLAHELGHIALGHLAESVALIDIEDPLRTSERDDEEMAADRFALAALTGSEEPIVTADQATFSAKQLADAAMTSGTDRRIEPGSLVMCYGYAAQDWQKSNAALRYIYTDAKPVWREVNALAVSQLEWSAFTQDESEWLKHVLGLPDA